MMDLTPAEQELFDAFDNAERDFRAAGLRLAWSTPRQRWLENSTCPRAIYLRSLSPANAMAEMSSRRRTIALAK